MFSLQEIADLVSEEERKSDRILHLTANETVLSPQAQRVLSSSLHSRYLLEHIDMREDSPSRLGGFLFRGLNYVNLIEKSAAEVCKKLFGAKYVEFRCLSGLHAMQTTIASLTKPGDKVMRFETKDGGHFATQHVLKLIGRESCCYVVDKGTLQIDLQKTNDVFQREKPALLYMDAMNHLFPFPLSQLKEITKDVPIVYDASHTLGLIAGGQFQNPLEEGADLLQANTHKTFFGPQKAIMLTSDRRLFEKISYDLSQGLVSSQHTASSLSLFVALHEMAKYGTRYAAQVVENAQYLAHKLHEKGLKVIGKEQGFTKNHQLFIDVTDVEPGPVLLERLLRANISVNRTVPFEKIDALRLGVQEVTRRGYTKDDLEQIAVWLSSIILDKRDPVVIAPSVSELVCSRNAILYCDKISREQQKRISFAETENDNKSRWVDYRRVGTECSVGKELFLSLKELARLASQYRQQTDSAGNVSLRNGNEILISTSGCFLKNLGKDDLVRVISVGNNLIQYEGKGFPSSEALMHCLIYGATGSNFIVHSHCIPTDAEMILHNIKMIPPKEIASVALAKAVAEASKESRIVYIQKHGLVFHAETSAECVKLMLSFM